MTGIPFRTSLFDTANLVGDDEDRGCFPIRPRPREPTPSDQADIAVGEKSILNVS